MYSWQSEFGNSFVDCPVLVTGATGFVGTHLCEALTILGAEVHGLSRSASAQKLGANCQTWAVDLKELDSLRRVVSQIRPQIVYHLAGLVTARQERNLVLPMLENNLLSTVHLLLALHEVGCQRLVVVGSSEEPQANDLIPTSPYAAAKYAATMYTQMFHELYGLPAVVARLFMSYGPRQPTSKLIPYLILSLSRGETPRLTSGERVCDLIYVLDVVRGLLRTGIQPSLEGQIVELGTGQGIQVRGVAKLLVELIGSSVQPQFGAKAERVKEQMQVANQNMARTILDWEPHWSLSAGLMETVSWYQSRLGNNSAKV